MPERSSLVSLLAVYSMFSALLAEAKIEILSTVIYTNHGDRTPLLSNNYNRLTTLGAQQMYDAGARIRTQYITPEPNSTDQQSQTWRLPPTLLDGEFLTIYTTREPYNVASAQAFMQGLYPPLFPNGSVNYIDASFYDANNKVFEGPFDGMQFPSISTASNQYANAMYLKGAAICPAFRHRLEDYMNTTKFKAMDQGSADLYQRLSDQYLRQVATPDVPLNYANAWAIYDYLNYQTIHNATVAQTLSEVDLNRIRILATDSIINQYANTTADGKVGQDPLKAIAGRTLASLVVKLFADSVLKEGTVNKVNLLFGDYAPMVSFAGLAQLAVPQHSQFLNLPNPGASFIFELLGMVPENSTTYPGSPDLFVRFLYTNGTGGDASTTEYSLFGASPSQTLMRLSDFTSNMGNIMIDNKLQWCNICQSTATFCVAERALDAKTQPAKHGLQPAVAGVIGALVTLIFVLLVVGFGMLLGGIRLHRVQMKRRSNLGGFKGSEKLASDQDLTLSKGGAGAVAVITEPGNHDTRGHERVGSWELRDHAKKQNIDAESHDIVVGGTIIQRSSFDDDDIHVNPFSDPVRPRDSV